MINLIKTGEKPYKCSHPGCIKEFVSLGNMKSHEANHSVIKPFECDFPGCGKDYSRLFRLEIHKRTHV
jgi:uncharacterized Zn-finger protein